MNNCYDYYRSHLNSPVSAPKTTLETEIEYIFRVAREKAAAAKAERRRIQWEMFKETLARVFKRTPSLQSLLGH